MTSPVPLRADMKTKYQFGVSFNCWFDGQPVGGAEDDSCTDVSYVGNDKDKIIQHILADTNVKMAYKDVTDVTYIGIEPHSCEKAIGVFYDVEDPDYVMAVLVSGVTINTPDVVE